MHYTIVGPHERAVIAAHENTQHSSKRTTHTKRDSVQCESRIFDEGSSHFGMMGSVPRDGTELFFLIYDHIFLDCSTSITQIWTCWPIKTGPLHVQHSYDGWFAIATRHNCVEMKYVRHGKMTIMNQNYCLFEKLCESAYPICMTHLMPLFQSIAHSKTQTN